MSTFKERLIQEQLDLNEKVEKLRLFIDGNEVFKTLSEEHQYLLKKQLYYMGGYNGVLMKRIDLLKDE